MVLRQHRQGWMSGSTYCVFCWYQGVPELSGDQRAESGAPTAGTLKRELKWGSRAPVLFFFFLFLRGKKFTTRRPFPTPQSRSAISCINASYATSLDPGPDPAARAGSEVGGALMMVFLGRAAGPVVLTSRRTRRDVGINLLGILG